MLSELLPEEKRRIHEIEQQIVEIEQRGNNSSVQLSDVILGLDEVKKRLTEFDRLLDKESKAKKDDFRRRLQYLRTSYDHLVEKVNTLSRKSILQDEKARLFGNRRDDNTNKEDYALELAENGSLIRSNQMIQEYIAIGQGTLTELMSQKERLKSIQRKALDMLNYLGISSNLLKSVERRDIVDKYIVYIGMVVILIVLFLVWYFVKR